MKEDVFIQIFRLGLYSHHYFGGISNPNAVKTMVIDDFGNAVKYDAESLMVYFS